MEYCKEDYGIKKGEKITPVLIRDAIIDCFICAHKEILEMNKEFGEFKDENEFNKMGRFEVTMLVKKSFDDVGADFENPSKKDLIAVLEKLKEYALNFRGKEIVSKHYAEMLALVDKLE